jgi:predicted nucleotidyltransferase
MDMFGGGEKNRRAVKLLNTTEKIKQLLSKDKQNRNNRICYICFYNAGIVF